MDTPPIPHRPTIARINLGALQRNYQRIASHVDTTVMPIVKANAYGHGLVVSSQALVDAGATILGVAILEEGIALRQAGINCPILVLGGVLERQITTFFEYDLMLTAGCSQLLKSIDRLARTYATPVKPQVHLKIDTGMGRLGASLSELDTFLGTAMHCEHLHIDGIFTHFANADIADPVPTQQQLDRFLQACDWFLRHDYPCPKRHAANSGAVAQYPDTWLDIVRPGILMYGVYPSDETQKTVAVEPALQLESQVVHGKYIQTGQAISYGSTWTAAADTYILTIPCGYGDGYLRALSGQAQVLIQGQRYPIVGRICMDQCMVDSGAQVFANGETLTLIGQNGEQFISAEELAAWAGTIPYEILTSINARVPRLYYT